MRSPMCWSDEDVADYLGVSASTVHVYQRECGLPSYKMGGLRRYRQDWLDLWLESLALGNNPAQEVDECPDDQWPLVSVATHEQTATPSASKPVRTRKRAGAGESRGKRQPTTTPSPLGTNSSPELIKGWQSLVRQRA